MKQIIVNVSGLKVEEKQRVNEALEKITGATKLPYISPLAVWFFAPDSSGGGTVSWGWSGRPVMSTHTPQQALEMAGMAKQGHVHAENMAQYAEDAKTTDKPWELWQFKDLDGNWVACRRQPVWDSNVEYRRKPKTHFVHGVEVPDLRFNPQMGDSYYIPSPDVPQLYFNADCTNLSTHSHRYNSGLCYEYTEAGKQAAILHSKAWLGIA